MVFKVGFIVGGIFFVSFFVSMVVVRGVVGYIDFVLWNDKKGSIIRDLVFSIFLEELSK